jgi:predicted ATPase/class 3 adenylate cyclase
MTAGGRSDPLPSGTVTFLFSDIEGSTNLARQLGPDWSAVLRLHRDLLRAAFTSEGGHELGTEGDSFFVVFPSARAAVAAAAAAQRALTKAAWPGDVSLRVRMGIHTAEAAPEGTDRSDYTGLEVHRAARIAATAHGGQVVLSSQTVALIDERPPAGVGVRALGAHRLKDFPEPEDLHQLLVEGLAVDFPPLRSLGSRRADVPYQLTSFVGRASDVAAVERLIGESRLLTLTGPGGTGKTRLAIRVAGDMVDRFDDGASFVPLAPITDPGLVPGAIAQVLGVLDAGDRPLTDTLVDFLRDRKTLLVLDNFEHLMPGTPIVSHLLASASGLHILATSREILHLAGEREYSVAPLAVPDTTVALSTERLLGSDAVVLFVDRARAVLPGFALTDANARAVVEICRRLDGLPLAIELAAARLRILSPEALLERLANSLDILSGGARDLPSRQRTLRAAIEWSEQLLEEPDRLLFRRLAVFRGGWTFEAAEAIIANLGGPVTGVFEGIASLADKSLIRPLTSTEGEPRFLMLETIREYGVDRLIAEAELEQTERAHAFFFARLADEARSGLEGDEGPAWLDRLDREIGNIRAALEWFLEHDGVAAMEMGANLWRFWHRRGLLGEGRMWLERIVATPGTAPPRARAQAYGALGSVAYWQNDFARTRTAYEESLATWREAGEDAGIVEALYNLGFAGLVDHRFEDARAAYAESIALAERIGDRRAIGRLSFGLGMVAMVVGELDEARRRFEESIPVLEATGDQYLTVSARRDLVEVAIRSGRLDEAREGNRANLTEAHLARDPTMFAMALEDLATIEAREDRLARALRIAGAAAAVKERAGGGAPPPLVTVADVKAEAAGRLADGEIERYWEEGRAFDDEAAYALAIEADEAGT